jgi:hypothetical protein
MARFLLLIRTSQYRSDGRLKKSEVTERFRKLKSSSGDVVSLVVIATANMAQADPNLTDIFQRVRRRPDER